MSGLAKALNVGKDASKKKQKSETQLSMPEQQELEVMNLEVSKVHPDPEQPRKSFDDDAFFTLVAQIKATNGCQQPIKVRPHPELMGEFMIKFGERRWRSHKELGYTTIPAILDVQEHALFSVRLEQVIENVGRDDLNRYDEAVSYRSLIDIANQEPRDKKFTQKDLAQLLGYKAPYLSQIMAILKTPESVQALSIDGITQNVNVFSCLNKLKTLMSEEEFALLVDEVRNGEANDKELQQLLSELTKPAKEENQNPDGMQEENDLGGVSDPLGSQSDDENDGENSSNESGSSQEQVDYGFYDYGNVYDKALFDALIQWDLAFAISAEQKDQASENLEKVTGELESQGHKLKDLLKLFAKNLESDKALEVIQDVESLTGLFTDALAKLEANRAKLQDCNFVEMESFEVVDGFILVNIPGMDAPLKLSADDVKSFSESI